MSDLDYAVVRFASNIDLTGFDCGAPAYNAWLQESASSSVSAGVSAVYLLLEHRDETTRVVGYFAISPTRVAREQAPFSFSRGWPREVRAWNLGKVAVHVNLRADEKAQWGRQLLRHALETIVAVADSGGGKVIVVDADNERLVDFYSRNTFMPTGHDDDLSSFVKVSTVRKALMQ